MYNAFDQRQVYMQQHAVLINQDQGPLVASEAREAIAQLEATAQASHDEAIRNTRSEMNEVAQHRLRTAESNIAGHAQEAYDRRVADMSLFQDAEAQQTAKLRSELLAANQTHEDTQTEAVKRMSEFEHRMNEMTNLIAELKATKLMSCASKD